MRMVPQVSEHFTKAVEVIAHGSDGAKEQECENGVPSDILNEQPGQKTTSLRPDPGRLQGQDVMEHEDHGMVAEQHLVVAPGHKLDGGQHNEGTQHTMQSRRSGGECLCPNNFPSVNIHQFQRGHWGTPHLRLIPFYSMPQRRPHVDLDLSKLS